jgi:hypothetical protein
MRRVAAARHAGVVAIVFAAATLGACEGYVKRGSALYADGRYVEAAEVFERTEHRLGDSSAKERAEYGVYRGMTLLVLGDLKNAQRWLAYAYEVERHKPGSLRTDRRALLDRGWFELGQRLRTQPGANHGPPGTAIAASQPPPPVAPPAPDQKPAPPKDERSLVPQ